MTLLDYDRNRWRFRAAVDGFRARYGVRPTKIRMFPESLQSLRGYVFTPVNIDMIENKIELVSDESAPHIAEECMGRQYNYGKEGLSSIEPDIGATDWFGVVPDRPEPQWPVNTADSNKIINWERFKSPNQFKTLLVIC